MGNVDLCVGLDFGLKWSNLTKMNDVYHELGFAFAVIDITDDDQVHKIVNHGGTNGERELEIPAPFFLERDLIRAVDFIMWRSAFVGRLSTKSISLLENDERRMEGATKIDYEMKIAKFFGFPAVMAELPAGKAGIERLAGLFDRHYCVGKNVVSPVSHVNIWAVVKLESEEDGSWERWNEFRRLFPISRQLGVCLEFSPDGYFPNTPSLERWLGEPIKTLVVPASIFQGENCTLPPAIESLMKKLFLAKGQVIIKGVDGYAELKDLKPLGVSVKSVFSNRVGEADWLEKEAVGFVDYLQIPLQPLADHLEASTYQCFEADPCKYVMYENAVHDAIVDMKTAGRRPPFVLMVVGAGRGPLVDAAMRASSRSGIELTYFAVEKNPNAVNLLLMRQQTEEEWKDVQIIACDMREWKTEARADILVSELLGSFGDNELSPECLDGAQRFLKSDGISIPQSYTSYMAPIQSYKLYSEVRCSQLRGKDVDQPMSVPYVVHMQLKWRIADPKKVFTFTHPNWDLTSNDRHEVLSFEAPAKGVLHGFAGYFDTVLYKDNVLSIHPLTHSDELISWFPVFIPIKEPVEFEPGDKIEVAMWRKSDESKVWYEYQLTSPKVLDLQNKDGSSTAMLKVAGPAVEL